MKSFLKLLNSLVTIAVVVSNVDFAQAAQTRSWVASNGNDTSPNCSATAPCATFGSAFSKTSPGGEISCLSSGSFGGLVINKSITINCDGYIATNLNPSTANYDLFYIDGTVATDTVVLRGLNLSLGRALNLPPFQFHGAGTLILDKMNVGSEGFGVSFDPTGPGRMNVYDSTFSFNGDFGVPSGGGVIIQPYGSGSARVLLERVKIGGNSFGLAVDGSTSTGGINVTIADSVTSGNTQDGIVATSSAGHAAIGLMVTNTKSTNNAYGIRSIGSNVTVRVEGSKIVGNNIGLSATSGSALLSGHNNFVQANGSNGAFTGSMVEQ